MLTSNKEKWSKIIVASFLAVPVLASIISTLRSSFSEFENKMR